ncbi:MAG: hypothetical protein KC636_13605, partial [Myxococcales bacterium]|nr:hypothetical protein [Myxococcales bacterium]
MSPDLAVGPLQLRSGSYPSGESSARGDARTSSTGGFAFPFAGHAGHPELVVERGGRGSSAPLHRHGSASW